MLIIIDGIHLFGLCRKLMDGHIHYGFGSKTALSSRPEDITSIDCSGFVRYLMYQASSAALRMPDGSVVQNEWCGHQQLPLVNYRDAARHDQLIRIAFLPPHHGHAGHVWLIHQGRTLESHGGKGPDRRIWNTPVLIGGVTQCYELAIVPFVRDFTLPQYTYA